MYRARENGPYVPLRSFKMIILCAVEVTEVTLESASGCTQVASSVD